MRQNAPQGVRKLTFGGDLGIAPHVIKAALNHISGTKAGVAGLYNRSRYDEERRRALVIWGQTITRSQGLHC